MRFPFALYKAVIPYLIRQRFKRAAHTPMVLMLEPTLKCNLDCMGCGRIEDWKNLRPRDLTLEQCLKAVDDSGVPVVSICGGEPTLWKPLPELVVELDRRRKYIYLCSHAMFLDRVIDQLPETNRLCFSIHLDGMKEVHDRVVDKEGVFEKAIGAIQDAKAKGYRVYTNTTVFESTDPEEVLTLFDYLETLEVDGFFITAAYWVSGDKGENTPNRQAVHRIFNDLFPNGNGVPRLKSTPLYIDYLQGKRNLSCTPWGTPNYTPRGWKGPCYVLDEAYFDSYQEMIERIDFSEFGPGNGDVRCNHCVIHSGFEPTVALGRDISLRDQLKLLLWNFVG